MRKSWIVVLVGLALGASVLAPAGTTKNLAVAGAARNSVVAGASEEGQSGNGSAMSQSRHSNQVVLSFGTMYGVDGPFVGEDNPIRDVVGDELPWELKSAKGSLGADGHLAIQIRGLVFKDDPSVPEELRGINDEASFRALVSCVTEDERNDTVGMENVITARFPATKAGDSKISTRVELPNPCVAPIVMILAGSEDKWFAVTGVETEEEDGDDED